MPNWKKVITSGSDASLNSLDVALDITGSNALITNDLDVLGNVGIGTTSPSNQLHVYNTENGGITVERASGAQILIKAQSAAGVIATATNHDLDFKTNGSTKLKIENTGNVGIGTISPALKLDINSGTANSALRVLSTDRYTGIKFEDATNNVTLFYDGQSDLMYLNNTNFQAVDIYATGNVGIGTTSPSYPLEIAQTGYGLGIKNYITSTDVANSILAGYDSAAVYLGYGYGSKQVHIGSANSGDVKIRTTGNTIIENGNLGIGTTSPGEKLDVNGNIKLNQYGQSIYFGSTVNEIKGSASDFLYKSFSRVQWDNAGTYADSSYVFKQSGSEVFRIHTGGNVGIGTTSPEAKLDIVGTPSSDYAPLTAVSLTGKTASGTGWSGTSVLTGYTHSVGNSDSLVTNIIPSANTKYLITFTISGITSGRYERIIFGGVEHNIYVSSNLTRTIAIKTANTNPLEVVVQTQANGAISIDSVSAVGSRDSVITTKGSDASVKNQIRNGHTVGSMYIGFKSGESITSSLSSVNLGIGYQTLKDNISGTANTVVGYNNLSNSFATSYVTALGYNLFPNYSNPTNAYSIAIGTNIATTSQMTGGQNILLGNNMFLSATTAGGNVAMGYSTMRNVTTGSKNTALGSYALFDSTTGIGNVAIGEYSLSNKVSGNHNLSIGNQAGRYLGGTATANLTSDNSIFLGYKAGPNGDSETNQIVIGHQAIGSGSNSVTLGATTITKTILNGNVGIGTTSPEAKLHIEASDPRIKIVDTDGTNWQSEIFTQGGSLKLQARNGTNFGNISFQGDNGTTQSEYARFNSVGNLGIGTTNPQGILHISDANPEFILEDTTNQNKCRIKNVDGNLFFEADYQNAFGNSRHQFYIDGSEKLRINTDGNVGIGTTSPSFKLDVTGTGNFTGLVSGITPVDAANFVTKAYADGLTPGAGVFLPLTGGTLTGNLTITGGSDIFLADNGKTHYGASNDLEIYHNGTHSYIDEKGTGDLIIRSTLLRLQSNGGESMINASSNGTVQLYYDNSEKLKTATTGITITGTATATTFSGDLNGTINTVTTAVTKANATNDTTVATTAFVQNLIGTIPAGLVFQGTWNAATNSPTLANGTGTTGHFYIVSTDGSTNLDGITDWKVGDWAVFVEQGATDAWEKVDNSSVLDGSGTGNQIAKWAGSGTSNTLTNSIITDDGTNVGIGVINPSAKLEIAADVTTNVDIAHFSNSNDIAKAKISLSANSSGELSLIDGSNNTDVFITSNGDSYFNGGDVGIGTTSPSSPLHIEFNSTSTTFPAGTGDYLQVENTNTTVDTHSSISLRSGTADSFISTVYKGINTGDLVFSLDNGGIAEKMRILANGNVGIGTVSPSEKLYVAGSIGLNTGQSIKWGAGATKITGIDGSYISFYPNNSEKVRFLANGNVGIGTTAPGAKLEVVNPVVNGAQARFKYSADYYLDVGYNRVLSYLSGTQDFRIGTGNGLPMSLVTNNAQRLTVISNGNVGIGTTTPTYKLTVAGGIAAGGKVTYTKSAGSLDTTGYAVAGLTTSTNGKSAGFIFTCFGGGGYQRIVYSCRNVSGTWQTSKDIDEGVNALDIVASSNATTITFTFKARTTFQNYTPNVTVEATGTAINNTYA